MPQSGIGYPVVLKAVSPELVHKTERQAVALNLVERRPALACRVRRFQRDVLAPT